MVIRQEITREEETIKTNYKFCAEYISPEKITGSGCGRDGDKLVNKEGFAQTLHHSTNT